MARGGALVGALTVALTAVVTMVGGPSCTVAGTCEYTAWNYCDPASTDCHAPNATPFQGHLVDPYTWESVPLGCAASDVRASCAAGGAWIDYPGERGYFVQLADSVTHQLIQGRIAEVSATVGTSAHPDTDNTKFTVAGGNLAVWSLVGDPHWLYVQNDSCAPYTLRLTVRAEPTAASDGGSDAPLDSPKD